MKLPVPPPLELEFTPTKFYKFVKLSLSFGHIQPKVV